MNHKQGPVRVPPLRLGWRALFWIVLVAMIPAVPLCAVEGLLRLARVTVADDPYVSLGWIPPFFSQEEADGRRVYRMTNWETYRWRNIVFPVEKAPNAFRVFCLGGSASAGWPHPPGEIYSAYLQQALQRAFPDRKVEVINASAHAYAAYRVRLIFEEVLRYQPDLIVLYSGNNEFLEKRTYADTAGAFQAISGLMHRLLVFRLARGSAVGRYLFPENTLWGAHRDHVTYEQWSKIEQLALELRSDATQFQRVREHYAFSIESMVLAARAHNVPVILLTVPVNLREWHPNVSEHSLSEPALSDWERRFRTGWTAALQGDFQGAVRELRVAIDLDPLYAEAHFQLARALERRGEFRAASDSYGRARDLDYNPFRALSDFNHTVREIAARYGQVTLVDADAVFRAESAPLAPGFDLFLDYVHPSKRGNLVLAETVFNAIIRKNLGGSRPALSDFALPIQPGGEAYDDLRDFRMQGFLLRLFVMMHQYESAIEKARYLLQTAGASESLREEDVRLARGVLEVFPEIVEADRKQVLSGAPVMAERERLDQLLRQFYRTHYPGYEEFHRRYGRRAEQRAGVAPASDRVPLETSDTVIAG